MLLMTLLLWLEGRLLLLLELIHAILLKQGSQCIRTICLVWTCTAVQQQLLNVVGYLHVHLLLFRSVALLHQLEDLVIQVFVGAVFIDDFVKLHQTLVKVLPFLYLPYQLLLLLVLLGVRLGLGLLLCLLSLRLRLLALQAGELQLQLPLV